MLPKAVVVAWAFPWTAVGLLVGLLGMMTGGHARRRGPVIEFHGGMVTRFLPRLPGGQYAMAMTLAHAVLGQTSAALDVSRKHELVHVRQYERWGLLFVARLPALLGRPVAVAQGLLPRESI